MRTNNPPRYVTPGRARPGLSLELSTLVGAVIYGAVIGASIASGFWWWLG